MGSGNLLPRCARCRTAVAVGQNVMFRPDGRVEHAACPPITCPSCQERVFTGDAVRRNGEALLHLRCWMRIRRQANRAPDAA